ncbi:uncharacterized protein TRAVEDRAFT_131878 [Trametes versicolor FP-101664 SS1]|uniref:uncharacterized protein n=1 Tax=Trametes versicolor (strain FP-101664) TaxID=717944 RepID=UPI00046212F3|nr:uncharacterized protein TRAVEDRAFT_131878 [Trametes versicolor FP-101664 SS1]EIW54218.1 hypothetical protein TRAVEDRAFT_131878 [Trametes versicolor FP-101664 SS1]
MPKVRRLNSTCYRKQGCKEDTPADYAIAHNLTPFMSMQNHYSLMYRKDARELFLT